MTALRSQLRRRLQSQLDKLCADLPRAEDMQLPYQPFTSKGLHTADKARNFIKVLPVLLLAAEGLARQKDWILLFTGQVLLVPSALFRFSYLIFMHCAGPWHNAEQS